MQVAEKKDMIKRILFYWAKLYTRGINEGDSYEILNKTICILITNYNIEELDSLTEYHTEWKIIENKYRKTVLTPVFEIHIISLPKLKNTKSSMNIKEEKLLRWCEFLLDPNNKNIERYDKIMKAKTELEKLKEDKREVWLAEQRQKYILDMKATEAFGYDKGMKEGIQKGMKEGIQKGSKEIAKNLLKEKVDVEIIVKVTKLTKDEIEKLKK